MNRGQYAFERQLSGVRSDGERIVITIAVGAPFKDDKLNSWACPVRADGLLNRLTDLHGINPLQAVRHTRNFIVWLLHDFVGKGGTLYMFNQYEEMSKQNIDKFFEQSPTTDVKAEHPPAPYPTATIGTPDLRD
jgi:hypothetical protein